MHKYSMPFNWTQKCASLHTHRHTYTCIVYYGIHSIKTNLFEASLKCDSNQFLFFLSFRQHTVFTCCEYSHSHTYTHTLLQAHRDTLNAQTQSIRVLVMGNNVTTIRKCSFKRNKHADNRKHKEERWKKNTTLSEIVIYGERL